jgi:PPP family 3-phenylpropionic acid transporter
MLPYIETFAVSKLKSSYGKARLFGSIGFIIVALVVAKFLDSSTVVLDFYLVSNIATVIISALLIGVDSSSESNKNISKKFSIFDNISFWIAVFLMQLSFGGFYNFFTIYELSYGVSIDMISYLWSFGVLCEILMLYYQAPLLKLNLLKIIKFTIFLTSFRWMLLYLFPSSIYITFFAQSLHALAFALYHTAVITYLFQIYSTNRLAQQFMFGISYGLGGFVGAIIAGYLYGENLFLYMSIIAFLGFIILKPFKN